MKFKLALPAILFTLILITEGTPEIPRIVPNVELATLKNKPTLIPHYGKKHMMVFYVDPDAHRQNRSFQRELKKDGRLGKAGKTASPKIQGYGILNLADTRLSPKVVRDITKLITARTPSIILADNNHTLRDAWKLGDVNNKFVLMYVTKHGEMVYYREGKLSKEDKEEFYRTVGSYR